MSLADLADIPNLEASSLELLEAAGYRRMEELAECHEEDLFAEIEKANRVLKIAEVSPDRSAVADWLKHAREVTGIREAPREEPTVEVIEEILPNLALRLQTAPMAIPLPGAILQEHGLTVPEIPMGISAYEATGRAQSQQGENRIPAMRAEISAKRSIQWQNMESRTAAKSDMDLSRLKTIHEIEEVRARLPKRVEKPVDDRVTLIRSPRAETNNGVDPESRRYVRGVLHSHPFSIFSGAVFTLVMMGLAPVAVISSVLLLLSRERPQSFDWVPKWWLVFPMALPVFAVLWAIWGLSGSCRVCGQRLFIHRPHRKNAKAHHVIGLGYVFPLCIHILLFRWFRCTHCGTPVRLKK